MSTTPLKTPIERAWNDIEPKVVAWIAAGGLLTAITIILGYVDPSFPLPIWVAPVVTYLGGLLAAYLKKSVVKTAVLPAAPAPADAPDTTLPAAQ